MSHHNVKLLNDINFNFVNILEKYSNNVKVLNRINSYIKESLETHLNKIHREVENLDKIEKEKNYFINKFLSSMENIFYYIEANDRFIHYDMKHYKIFEEDELCNQIYNDIMENHNSLHSLKFDVLTDIINELKTHTIFTCLPESYTIQSTINYLMTYFFSSKDDAKYFCCIIGDIVLNKSIDVNICINDNLHYFISTFEAIIQKVLGEIYPNNFDEYFLCDTIIKSKKIEDHRILKSTTENQHYLWNDFLNKHAIDLLAVCIHYSRRYINSENYLTHHKNSKTILYLKNNTSVKMIEDFCLNSLNVKKDSSINYENMDYLWHHFLKKNHIPGNLITHSTFHKTIKTYVQYDHLNKQYLSIFHANGSIIQDVKHFLKTELVNDVEDELEISELIAIFEEQHYSVNEDTMIDLVKYFTKCKLTIDNKLIKSTRCKLWDKKGELNTFISIMKQGATSNYPITTDLSFNTIYTKYCKYTSNNGNVSKIVTKKYFVDYIINTIPNEFIVFNKVIKDFWY